MEHSVFHIENKRALLGKQYFSNENRVFDLTIFTEKSNLILATFVAKLDFDLTAKMAHVCIEKHVYSGSLWSQKKLASLSSTL